MAWSPDSKTLVTGANKSLYIWDIKVYLSNTACHRGCIADVSFQVWHSEIVSIDQLATCRHHQYHPLDAGRIRVPRRLVGLQADLLCEYLPRQISQHRS